MEAIDDNLLSNGYEPMKVIGKGSIGRAVLCKRLSDGIRVVVKQVNVSDLDATAHAHAMQEVCILKALVHPNIIAYHDSFTCNGTLNIVMDYADGGDLNQFMYARAPRGGGGAGYLPEDLVLHIFAQLVCGLYFVHSNNIMHRDLKCANVLLTRSGIVKIADFGVARVMSDGSDMAHTMIGTPYYLSPEMCDGRPYSKSSDVWAIGCILYELVCLARPFEGRSLPALIMKILAGDYPSPPSDFSPEIHRLIKDLLQTSPSSRPTLRALLSRPVLRSRIETFLLQQGERHLYQSARGTAAQFSPVYLCVLCDDVRRYIQPRDNETWWGAFGEGQRVC